MKPSGKCPKCGGTEIIKRKGTTANYGIGNTIALGVTVFHGLVPVTRYICLGCGYSEEWIDEDKDLARLRKRFGGKG